MPENLLTPNFRPHETSVDFINWGLVPYEQALVEMMSSVERVSEGSNNVVIFCSHPPIVTLGRATVADHVTTWAGQTLDVARGGSATYHGPSQLVVYPIVHLKNARRGRGPQEIGGFLRDFEGAIVRTLAAYGVEAVGRSVRQKDAAKPASDETGVWVGDRKIASLGLGVRKWTTFHGAAINLDQDPTAFVGINPCGFSRDVMVSLEELLGGKVDRAAFTEKLRQELEKSL